MHSFSKKLKFLGVIALICSGCSLEESEESPLQTIEIETADQEYRVVVHGAFQTDFDQVLFRSISPDDMESEHKVLVKEHGDRRSITIGNLLSRKENGLAVVEGAIIANSPLDGVLVSFPEKLYPRLRNEKGERVKTIALSGMLAAYQLTELKNGSWGLLQRKPAE